MKYLIALLLFSLPAQAKTFRVAIIDTGLNLNDPRFSNHLCESGHKDFTGVGLVDEIGHGTHVAGLIRDNAGEANYCLIIVKYYREEDSFLVNAKNFMAALAWSVSQRADLVNISSGGSQFQESEYLAIKNHPEITFVTSAGNNHKNIDLPNDQFFPASYDLPNVKVVGGLDSSNKRSDTSNYGKRVRYWEKGDAVSSDIPCSYPGKFDCRTKMTGTSQATAIHTGKLLRSLK